MYFGKNISEMLYTIGSIIYFRLLMNKIFVHWLNVITIVKKSLLNHYLLFQLFQLTIILSRLKLSDLVRNPETYLRDKFQILYFSCFGMLNVWQIRVSYINILKVFRL